MSGGGWSDHRGSMHRTRTLEYTSDEVKTQFQPNGVLDLDLVTDIPALFASETMYDDSQASARVGTISKVRQVGSDYQLEYLFDADVPPIPNSILKELQVELNIGDWEFSRTHWAIKDADLFKVLFKTGLGKRQQPKVFSLGDEAVNPNLVAVMMPFDAAFNPVYAALQEAVAAAGMECKRADDIWNHDHVIQDVVSLICTAAVVVCDLTNRNSNVFYEMGIAHALARDVVMITQNAVDVPFDVAHIRHIRYLKNGEGLRQLATDVSRRLTTLKTKA